MTAAFGVPIEGLIGLSELAELSRFKLGKRIELTCESFRVMSFGSYGL
jgi:hypothetical protein